MVRILDQDRSDPVSLDSRGHPLRLSHYNEYIAKYRNLTPEWLELDLPSITQPFAPWLVGKQRPDTGVSAHLELDKANDAIVDWAFVTQPFQTATKPAATPPIELDRHLHESTVEWVDWNHLKVSRAATQTVDVASVINCASKILCRLPATPPPFIGSEHYLPLLDKSYFLPNSEATWGNLRVVNFIDSNTIRLAMHIAWPHETISPSQIADTENNISRCMDAAIKSTKGTKHGNFFMKAFLWAAWHRIAMLHRYSRLGMQLRNPDSVIWYPRMGIIGTSLMKKMSVKEVWEFTPAYMCNWAFRLVSEDQAAFPPDFRALTERFADVFGHLDPRCITRTGHEQCQCEGDTPEKCMRFAGAVIHDQSAHAAPCQGGCNKLTWDEASYQSLPVEKGRAVSLTDSSETSIRYISAGPTTMAVTHVWSHGQGGRPEFYDSPGGEYSGGYNSCLHFRFKRICEEIGCDSYWMDTPCIPSDHALRSEEISHINDVFLDSKVTLVCDRDIMTLDVENPTMQTMESILATVLVCDWNVRAWTLLEAFRATNIHLLGKDDKTISLQDILMSVWRSGDISLGNLFFTIPHLIPTPNHHRASDREGNKTLKTLDVAKAAAVLKNRHASRPDDDIVIWSLLCEEKPSQTPKDLWVSIQQKNVRTEVSTAFLMSKAPRVQGVPGLSWAPMRPNLPTESEYSIDFGNSFTIDHDNCTKGTITKRGLIAKWRIAIFPMNLKSTVNLASTSKSTRHLGTLASRYLQGYRWGAIIQPSQDARSFLDLGQLKKGTAENLLVAILGTRDQRIEPLYTPRNLLMQNPNATKWTWVGVHEWQAKQAELPLMRPETILIS
ncbi:hypothetical protein QBC38DRAFT_362133 [Podospora fimiseda]|uniref:Heterokaryon incompatibility domain-containing protein n=1 Tax=Podospora fimiseda TaxID=252190 RepID=A0AAN7BRS4_9PEZI|nr:hypothetical protein QBC38DRAFT_362133 [Podospora fimiseda]